jgi:hypothetical protein
MSEGLLSDSKRRLGALLECVSSCVKTASKDVCDDVFRDVARFAQHAVTERNRRIERDNPTRVLLLHARVPKRAKHEEVDTEQKQLCPDCNAAYSNELLCDGCNEGFRWCCAGYAREPCEDPLQPLTGAKIMLQAFCPACLESRGVTAATVLQQEEECFRILAVFAKPGCRWKWISCVHDGWSIFSAVWTALEGLLFLLSPFYCQIGTQCDVGWRESPDFHEFLRSCAHEAIRLLPAAEDEAARMPWLALRARPDQPPNLGEADFRLAWQAVARHLNVACPTRVCIWKCEADGLQCAERYGCSEAELVRPRVIDILQWNGGVSTHFDLMIPVPDDASEDLAHFGEESALK